MRETRLKTCIGFRYGEPAVTHVEYGTAIAPAIAQGELILASKVSDLGEKVMIVQGLGPNKRAMALKEEAETAVGASSHRATLSIPC